MVLSVQNRLEGRSRMDGGDYASVFAAIVAAFSAWAVARSSSRANKQAKELETKALIESKELESSTAKESLRQQAETDAYERARAFDIATIQRQEAELLRVRADNSHLHIDNRRLNEELHDSYAERDALRNEIRNMHDERGVEREECRRMKMRLAELEGRPAPSEEELNEGYSEPGLSYPDLD